MIGSELQSQFWPQLAGLNVKVSVKGKLLPVGVPEKAHVPHSNVG